MRRSAAFVKDLKLEDLDGKTIEKAKDCVLDFIGAVLGGAGTRAGKIALSYARDLGGPPEASIWSVDERVSCRNAAFVHGTMGCALDIDDGHRVAVGHPGGVVIPGTYALAESRRRTGKEFLEAVVCGYEVGIRVGHILRLKVPPGTSLGSGRWGSVGAAAAAAKLLRLNHVEEIGQALAIGATYAPVSPVTNDLEVNGTVPMTKFGSGWGAEVGISSALLAQKGFTGVSSTIDFSSSSLPDYGESFEVNNVYFKPYTSCRWTHPVIEGVIQLKKDHPDLTKETIKKITVRTFLAATHLRWPHPRTMESSQYSIPYLVGAAMVYGEVGPDQIAEEKLLDPDIFDVAEKTEVKHDPKLDKEFPKSAPAEIEIDTIAGPRYRVKVTRPKGDPLNPMSERELTGKFKRLASKNLSPEASERVIEAVRNLDKLPDLSKLTGLLQGRGSGA